MTEVERNPLGAGSAGGWRLDHFTENTDSVNVGRQLECVNMGHRRDCRKNSWKKKEAG